MLEERAARVNVHGLRVDQRAVTLLRVFFGGVAEEARADRLLYTLHLPPARYNVQLMSVHDAE